MTSLADLLGQVDLSGDGGLADFDEEPVPLDVFIKDARYLLNPALSDVQYEAVRHIERVYLPETYKVLTTSAEKKIRTYWGQPCRMVNLISIEWGKGSYAPYMRVYNAETGQWVRLDQWQAAPVASASLADGSVSVHPSSSGFLEGRGEMFRVTTRRGFVADVWEGHRFLTWAQKSAQSWTAARRHGVSWQKLSDLYEGDPIAVSAVVPEPVQTIYVPDRDVELIGLELGNGSVGRDHGARGHITWGVHAVASHARTRELFEAYPDTWVDERELEWEGTLRYKLAPKRSGSRIGRGGPAQYSEAVWGVIARYGLAGHDCFTKRVPQEFFSLPTRQVALFLSRLIDTDGWVSFSNTAEIGFSTASKGLAWDIQHLALRLGVSMEYRVKTTTYQHGEGSLAYTLRVRDAENLERLASRLTLLDKEPARLAVLEWCAGKIRRRAAFGDLIWDSIESIEPLGEGEYWTLTEPENHNYVAEGGIVNHNSGKDHVARIAALRVAYLLMCLRSPLRYYALPEQDSIHILNVASSAPQARRAFFAPMRRAVLRPRNWFQTLGVDVLEGPRGRPRKEGESTQALMDTIRFAKQIEAVSGHSDADTQEGLNLILGIADEIDAFRSRAELVKTGGARARESSASAEAVLEMLRTSGSTRFPKVYKNVRISYPRYKGSTIQKLVAEGEADIAAKGTASRHYVSGPLATWEVNPRIQGKEDFADDYEKDPVMAAAKYECRPSFAVNPYFSNEIALRSCVNPGYQPVTVDYVRDGAAWRPVYVFSEQFYPVRGALYAMHADLAVTSDRAGISLAHVKTWKEVTVLGSDEAGLDVNLTELRPVVKVDFVFGYEADKSKQPPLEIQIRWAGDLCLELQRRGFPIMLFTADQYQSVDLRQRLEARGIETDRFSLDKDELGWRTLRDLAYEGRLEVPDVELLVTELLQLSRLPNGKIDHPSDGSKDLADSVGGAVSGAIRVGGREDESGTRAYPGGQHNFGGVPSQLFQAPIGMPPLEVLASNEIMPQEVREREHLGLALPGGGWLDDFGEARPRST